MSPQKKDRQLISRCLSGDKEAAETFARNFSDIVYRSIQHTLIIKHITFTREDLMDLHNTVFLHIFERGYRKLRLFKGKNGCSLSTWIRVVTVRIVLNHTRKKGIDSIAGRKQLLHLEDLQELRDDRAGAWTLLEKSEQMRLLREGIRNLPSRYRLFFKLHFDQGFSVPEVAEAMHVSAQNAHTIKHRAIQKLKSYLLSVASR